MRYAMFRCCVTAKSIPEYDRANDALLAGLGIEAVEMPGFGCCGYPLKNVDFNASLAASARNLALAEQSGKTILTSCACCFGTLHQAARLLADTGLRDDINKSLELEGLSYEGGAEVRHLYHVLEEKVGAERISGASGGATPEKVAMQYGCKLLRPGLQKGGSSAAEAFEGLVAASGAEVAPWGLEKECCGSGISTTDQEMAMGVSKDKMAAAREAGAESVVVSCPFCLLQLRKAAAQEQGVSVLSVSQLLCDALGFSVPPS